MDMVKKLYTFSDLIKRDIIIRRRNNRDYTVTFENCSLTHAIHSNDLVYAEGVGSTIQEALLNYMMRISGKMLVDVRNSYNIVEHRVPDFNCKGYENEAESRGS